MSSTKRLKRSVRTDKTLCVTVTIEATTDWEPNFFEDGDEVDFKPTDVEMVTKAYMEVLVGQEHLTVRALASALESAGFNEFVALGPDIVTRKATA